MDIKRLSMMARLPSDCVQIDYPSPVGRLTLIASPKGLHALLWEHYAKDPRYQRVLREIRQDSRFALLQHTCQQLDEYFNGIRQTFDLPLHLDGTAFQIAAWKGLCVIPYGETLSYQEHAMRLGDANKVRAVGGANGRNPISIIVPCHRVIAKSGQLNGFGGGLKTKKFLLELEGVDLQK